MNSIEDQTIGKMKFSTSTAAKLIIIGIIILIMLIPSFMIQSIIHEREMISISAMNEVSDKWARAQNVVGPILTIPYTQVYITDDKKSVRHHYYHILPEQLKINGDVRPEYLKRGIYKIVVYGSSLSLNGNFDLKEMKKLTATDQILWEDAFITIGISDLRGIKNPLSLKWNDKNLPVESGSKIDPVIASGITISVPGINLLPDSPAFFEMKMELNGSQNLSFTPVGGMTDVSLTSTWTVPSFDGSILPDNREVTDNGFSAHWSVLELNRNYPQSWTDNAIASNLSDSSFGVNLLSPIDDYQKSIRSAKYAVMILALTFLIFFLVEVLNHKKIHPFQYTLVGLALCLFYILLVSISEHSNFNTAYLISAIAVISMISLYSLSVFSNKKLSLTLASILSGLYGFLFITLQLADYALVMGSIGLAVILASTMYFTRHINWYDPILKTDFATIN